MTTPNDIIISNWMISKLHLTGTKLLSFALIFGAKSFSSDERSTFKSMIEKLGISRTSFFWVREWLVHSGLIRYDDGPDGKTIRVTDKVYVVANKA